jgi:hypothetical protein
MQHSVTLSIMEEFCYVECHFCIVSSMLSVTNKPFMLRVLMLSVLILSVSMLSVLMHSVFMLIVLMQSVFADCSYA